MSDTEKIVVAVNKDSEWLEPMWGCGFVDEVNGLGAEEIRDFIPTRHELIQLVKYWAEVEIDLSYFMFVYNQTGSDWLRKTSFAGRRIGRIARLMGDDEVKKAIDELKAKLCKESKGMDIYLNGSEVERAALREECQNYGLGGNRDNEEEEEG